MKRKNSAVMDGLDYIDPDIRPLARPIGDLNPDPANARKHPDRNLEAIKSSLARFGQKKPLVARPVNGSLIVVAGNGTLAAAKMLGWTHLAVSVKEMSAGASSPARMRPANPMARSGRSWPKTLDYRRPRKASKIGTETARNPTHPYSGLRRENESGSFGGSGSYPLR